MLCVLIYIYSMYVKPFIVCSSIFCIVCDHVWCDSVCIICLVNYNINLLTPISKVCSVCIWFGYLCIHCRRCPAVVRLRSGICASISVRLCLACAHGLVSNTQNDKSHTTRQRLEHGHSVCIQRRPTYWKLWTKHGYLAHAHPLCTGWNSLPAACFMLCLRMTGFSNWISNALYVLLSIYIANNPNAGWCCCEWGFYHRTLYCVV